MRSPEEIRATAHPNWHVKKFAELSTYELQHIMIVRQSVFVAEQLCAIPDADEYDELGLHCWAEDDEENLMAYARILPAATRFAEPSFGRLLVIRERRGTGLGHKLVTKLVEICESQFPGKNIKIGAQLHLAEFYIQHGFSPVGDLYMEAGIEHVEMVRSPTP